MTRKWQHVYVVMRIDPANREVSAENAHLYVTAISVWPTQQEALAEVNRLNALNADQGCFYFFSEAKVYASPTAAR